MMPILLLRKKNKPTIDMSFLGGAMPNGLTFTRASAGWYFDSTGILAQAAVNTPRFDYDPNIMTINGLLIEEQRTNSIANNTFQGASTSPSTLPTNWAVETTAGLTTTVVGLGTECGMPYMDVRINGTSTGTTYQLRCDYGTTASSGQVWTASAYVKKTGGTTSNVNSAVIRVREVGGSYNGTDSININMAATTLQRYTATRSWTTSYNAQWIFKVNIVSGASIDITFRLYAPQLEQGEFASSPILTTGSAATRAQDDLVISSPSWLNPTIGSFAVEGIPVGVTTSRWSGIANLYKDASNFVGPYFSITPTLQAQINNAGNFYVSVGSGGLAANTLFKMAIRYVSGDNNFAANGSLPGSGAFGSASLPSGLAHFSLGNRISGASNNGNFWLRRFRYWNYGLTNAQLQQVTQ